MMARKCFSVLLAVVMVIVVFTAIPLDIGVQAATIYVPTDYTTIQEAVDNALPGDTIYVYAGIYNEQVSISKSITLEGEDTATTIIDYSGGGSVVLVQGGNVIIKGFTIQGGLPYDFGIELNGAYDCNVSNNIVTGNSWGIGVESTSHDNTIYSNEISNNDDGIRVGKYSKRNTVRDNLVTNNNGLGIHVADNCDNTTLDSNVVTSNANHGINIFLSSYCNITNNYVYNNGQFGLHVTASPNANIIGNNISSNIIGMWIWNMSDDCVISENNIYDHNDYAIYMKYTYDCMIYHNNIMANGIQAYEDPAASNYWHHPTWLEGNYWSDYTGVDDGSGSGKHANGGDGIGDTLIPHPAADFDNYPFIYKNGWWRVHNIDLDKWYGAIQPAVDDASPGHTLEANPGAYYENVVVDKAIALTGMDKDTTVIDGGGSGDVVRISSDGVNMEGFTVRNSGNDPLPDLDSGLEIDSSDNCLIQDCVFTDNRAGIFMSTSSNNDLLNNEYTSNTVGVFASGSTANSITDSMFDTNSQDGVRLISASETIVEDNLFVDNGNGIQIRNAATQPNLISRNDFSSNNMGIRLFQATNNNIENNTCTLNVQDGIIIDESSQNTVKNNDFNSNLRAGISLATSDDNTIVNNTCWNNLVGFRVVTSNNNGIYYNNIIDNTNQLTMMGSSNTWDDDNGAASRGNFWSDYTGLDDGTGGRTAGDGVGDTLIPHQTVDSYPLMWPSFGGPVHNIDTDEYFYEIQTAIDDPDTLAGHEIVVEAGTYNENINVDKSLTLTGVLAGITTIDGGGSDDAVIISANDVTMSGFAATNSGSTANDYGIELSGVTNCVIDDCIVTDNSRGVRIDSASSGITVSLCDISSNTLYGIFIEPSILTNTITGNTITAHPRGIYLDHADNQVISGNDFTNNDYALYLSYSDDNDILNNIVSGKDFGIYLDNSHLNTMTGNTVSNNLWSGIEIRSSNTNTVSGSTITNNNYGVYVYGSDGTTIENNPNISDNERNIYLYDSDGSSIIGNTIQNSNTGYGVYLEQSSNSFIQNNDIIQHTYGIYLIDNSNTNAIDTNNDISMNENGIYVKNCLDITVDGNTITGLGTGIGRGIYYNTSTGSVNFNVIEYWDYAAKMNESGTVNTDNNNVNFCTYGILYDPSFGTIIGNTITHCIYAIIMDHSYAEITNNIISNNVYGIYCYHSDPLIKDNIISNNEYGIYLDHSSPEIEDNVIIGNIYGIFIGMGSDPDIGTNNMSGNTYDIYIMEWDLDIDPDTLNLKSQGRWITAYMEPPEPMDLTMVDISTVRISDIDGLPLDIPAESHPTEIDDFDGDGVDEIMVKFDRSEVQDACGTGDITITVYGELTDGSPFIGYCTIRVIQPGK